MNIFVLFGITGDLAKKKVLPALNLISESGNFLFIGAGRKPQPIPEFKKLPNHIYVQGDLGNGKIYTQIAAHIAKNLKESLRAKKSVTQEGLHINLIMYSAMPPTLHTIVAQGFARAADKLVREYQKKGKARLQAKILIEKPLGNSLAEAKKAIDTFSRIEKQGFEVLYVDHYLDKEPLVNLENLFISNPDLVTKLLPVSNIREIKAVLYEKEGIEDRGSFYDKIGALYDVGQNHMLQSAATIALMLCSQGKNHEKGKKHTSKVAILKNLQINGSPLFWQYDGYTKEKDVAPHSTTETFFSASFKIQKQKNLPILSISSGKMLDMNKSGVEVHFHDKSESLFIDFSMGSKDAYQIMFESALGDTLTCKPNSATCDNSLLKRFATKEEILEGWKIVERLKKLKTKANIIVYKKLRDILG